jgi:mono/diheme cytochrome c family protein
MLTHRQHLLLALALSLAPGLRAGAAETDTHPIVPGFERFYTDAKADASKGGQLLLGELNCVSCHTTDTSMLRKQAPILDYVASRARVGYLRKFLADPQAVKPGTPMPNLFAGDPEKAAKVEALVHFLASGGSVKQAPIDAKNVPVGKDLYHKVGCVACHGPRDDQGKLVQTTAVVVRLSGMKEKYSVPSLATFLENPQHSRPSGRMPQLVTGKDALAVAHYLLQGVKVNELAKGTTSYAYFEGHWAKLPDFAKLKPAATGTGPAFALSVAKRGNDYGIKFDGYFKLERDGEYRFTLHSDDGSKLYIDDKQVVDNDGEHPPKAVGGAAKLTKGVHKITVTFFQSGGGAELDVQIEGPGLGKQELSEMVAISEAALEKQVPKTNPDDPDILEFQPGLVEKGKALFASSGCASCHVMNVDKKPIASTVEASPLGKLKAEGGCLSAMPVKGLPWFALNAAQRKALSAAIKTPSPISKEPAEVIARIMTTFNCYACHTRGDVEGVDTEGPLNKFFQTLQPEMGDEGRVPPPLTGVGAKLQPEYLKQILDKGAHDRPYMHTRMPGFGLANVGALVEAFASVDKLPTLAPIEFKDTPGKVKTAGRHLSGAGALGCIKCHTFNGEKAEGVQGIDMTLMPQRVRRDWFHAYLLDPAKLRPGTRMPTSWPNGKSFYPDVLEGKSLNQIEAIWLYLSEGKAARLPLGIGGKKSIPLIPEKSAIIYRNFIQGAGTRAIAVGYPEKAHLAFDANEMHLAMIWQGDFIDAGRHWTDRGEGFQGPLGDNILKLHAGAAFAVLDKPEAAWPTAAPKDLGWKFKGYRLTPDDRPTFLYSFGDVQVEDFPNAVASKEPSLQRTLKLTAANSPGNLSFRAAVGTKIEAAGDGWYRIDGWKMKIESATTPVIRQSNGKAELLVPMRFADGKAQITQTFAW